LQVDGLRQWRWVVTGAAAAVGAGVGIGASLLGR
jgi:hypothetical protein